MPAFPALMLLLKRRRIGMLAVIVGALVVVVGMFLPLTQIPTAGASAVSASGVTVTLPGQHSLVLPLPNGGAPTGLALLGHVSAPLLSTTIGATIVDVAGRVGIVVMGLAALVSVLLILLPAGRGFIGLVAGLGLFGTAIEMGILLGERARTLSLSLCTGSTCQIDPHAGIWLCALGFGIVLLGGALAALRPLAGLVSGISFAAVGAVVGAGLAYLVAAQHVLDAAATAIR